MRDWSDCSVVERHPEIVSGAWVFRGTRVSVETLFENIKDGAGIDDFLAWFPTVTRDQVESVLQIQGSLIRYFPKFPSRFPSLENAANFDSTTPPP